VSKGNAFETEILELIFNNVDIPDIGDATGLRGSSVAGSLYVSLHTASPGEAGTMATNEAAYGSYARVAVPRSAGGWTVSGNEVRNAAVILFPACTSGSESITYFVVGKAASGPQVILYYGEVGAPFSVTPSIEPKFSANAMLVTEN
jgi:hypothetical protein